MFNKKLSRQKLKEFMVNHPPYKVVMEACYSSHYWGRTLEKMGHKVILIPAQHVTPFVRGNKNDSNDAMAIFEASHRPNLKTVPIKSESQQEILMLHRMRERLIKQKTALSNQMRGFLVDFGIAIKPGNKHFCDAMNHLPRDENIRPLIRNYIARVYEEYTMLNQHIQEIENDLVRFTESSESGQILLSIPGIGIINTSAMIASIDQGQAFSNARENAEATCIR